ncbi:MAG: prolyl oligopeptidase family serine peptidase [Spirochaetales bacterium]|nr:prolyl oligopeptidase family serine peptidase [Spirochaetales bacterium]
MTNKGSHSEHSSNSVQTIEKDWRDIDFSLDFDSKLPAFTPNYIFHTFHPTNLQQTQLLVTNRATNITKVLVDPNILDEQGLDWFYPSPCGQYVAYGLSSGGDEQSQMFVVETEGEKNIGKAIPHTSFAHIAWLPDSSGFYYSGGRGSDFEDAGKLLYFFDIKKAKPTKTEPISPEDPHLKPVVSQNGRYVAVNISWEIPHTAWLLDREKDNKWLALMDGSDCESFGSFYKDSYLMITTWNASRGRILSIPMESIEDRSKWSELVAESDAVIQHFTVTGGYIIISELIEASSRIRVVSLKDKTQQMISLPEIGLIDLPGSPDACPFAVDGDNVYFCYTSFTSPTSLYCLNLNNLDVKSVSTKSEKNLSNILVEKMSICSRDGEDIPCFMVLQKDIDRSKPSPLMIHAYGGWNTNLAPAYIGSGRSCVLPFVQAGGIYLYAGLRGGNEKGRDWWQNGRREKKQNTFNDLYDVAESLIKKGYTTTKKLAVMGASNGGLTAAAAIVQRPDLFRVVLSEVPLTDMIRAIKDPFLSSYTIEYGDPEDQNIFRVLMQYSPVHNVVQEIEYPSVFILSGRDDVRCQPWNGRKLAALLQEATSSENPILLKVVEGGHGPGLSLDAKVDRRTDLLSFLMMELGMLPQTKNTN